MIFFRKYVQIFHVMHSIAIIFYRYYIPPCSQITYEAESRMAKPQILKRHIKQSIQGMVKTYFTLFLNHRVK